VNDPEVAIPPLSVLGFPATAVPPVVQSGVAVALKHWKKSTVPVTVPLVPVRVATSVTDSPIVMLPLSPRLVVPCLTWVEMSGVVQKEKEPIA